VIPEAALFAFGVLTLMFAVVVTFDPRVLWDLADELGDRSQRPLPRTSADSAAVAISSVAGPPAPHDLPPTPPTTAQTDTKPAAPGGLPPAPHQG
jgi:paraquat-inducible protein A